MCARVAARLDWLFPERTGKKYKGNYAVPIGSGEFVIDVDAHAVHRWHPHNRSPAWNVCVQCLKISQAITAHACEMLEWYYSNIAIMFSGKNGFHIHVLDFDVSDWTKPNYGNLVKSYEIARFKFAQTISLQTYCFDRAHFTLSVDPMRVITIPNTLNADIGLVCTYIGDQQDLEPQTVQNILVKAQPNKELRGHLGYD